MRISDWSSDVCSSDLGYGAGADVINNNFSTPHREFTISGSAHNAFLQTTLDLGLTGLLLFFAIFIWSIREFFRNPSPFRDGMFLIVLISCMFESAVSKVANELTILWLISLFEGNSSSSPSAGFEPASDTTGSEQAGGPAA